MSSSHQLFIHHSTAYFLPTLFFFQSTVLFRAPTLDSGFADIVLLVLSIAIASVAHVIVTQRARSFMSLHAYSRSSTQRTFTPSCQRLVHEQFNGVLQ